ncbi:carbamate kinase [bacterium]|nr:carbamate kinase [bacterium]
MSEKKRVAVIALGGHAISHPEMGDDIHSQFERTRMSLHGIIDMIERGYRVALTHGNGPQVGNALLRNELARGRASMLPLGVLVASTQGWMGYMIEQSLLNLLHDRKIKREVTTVVSQVIVDRDDPSLLDPSKYIGQSYSKNEAERLQAESGWEMKFDQGRASWRRVVGSPIPKSIVNSDPIRYLLDRDLVVICAGGGGVPAYIDERGWLEGVDCVIDKDRASAVLAKDIDATDLIIITQVAQVALNFGRRDQQDLLSMTLDEAKEYEDIGHFAPGSMGPKIEAAIQFLEAGGERVIITDPEHLVEAIDGKHGTTITR